MRHVSSSEDLSIDEIKQIISGTVPLPDRDLSKILVGMLFLTPSTRTRSSMIRALTNLGISTYSLMPNELREESIADTALALSHNVDILATRVHGSVNSDVSPLDTEIYQSILDNSACPVLNLLTNFHHPTQGLGDLKTIQDEFGEEVTIKNVVLSWAYSPSWMRPPSMHNELAELLPRMGVNTTLVHPPEFALSENTIARAHQNAKDYGGAFSVTNDFSDALSQADIVYPRNWISLGYEQHGLAAEKLLQDKYHRWSFSDEVLDCHSKGMKYMHCMPIHRDYEAKTSVVDGPRSLVKKQLVNKTAVIEELIKVLLK